MWSKCFFCVCAGGGSEEPLKHTVVRRGRGHQENMSFGCARFVAERRAAEGFGDDMSEGPEWKWERGRNQDADSFEDWRRAASLVQQGGRSLATNCKRCPPQPGKKRDRTCDYPSRRGNDTIESQEDDSRCELRRRKRQKRSNDRVLSPRGVKRRRNSGRRRNSCSSDYSDADYSTYSDNYSDCEEEPKYIGRRANTTDRRYVEAQMHRTEVIAHRHRRRGPSGADVIREWEEKNTGWRFRPISEGVDGGMATKVPGGRTAAMARCVGGL